MAEQFVTLLAHWKGCEVFRNVGCTGSTDMVIKHPDLGVLEVDVKCNDWHHTGCWNRNGSRVKAKGVWPVEVTPEGDIANWKVSWGYNRTPPGWDGFWSNDDRIYSTNPTKHA